MNKKPVSYLQSDARWKNKPYRVKGESSTIGSAGCGPTSAAMLIETITGKTFTPEDACAWSIKHGYKALKQGTYYSYFAPQFKAFDIDCKQLLGSRILNQPNHPIHDQVKKYLQDGYYIIALMGPGTWTSGGHFIVVWDWDNKVRINDPASTRDERINGDPAAFRREVRMYWLVDAREFNKRCGPADGAIDRLTKLGVIDSPALWKTAAASGKVKHLGTLLIKAAEKITKTGPRSSTPENGIGNLVEAGVIDTPDYWLAHYNDLPNLGALLCALGGAVK